MGRASWPCGDFGTQRLWVLTSGLLVNGANPSRTRTAATRADNRQRDQLPQLGRAPLGAHLQHQVQLAPVRDAQEHRQPPLPLCRRRRAQRDGAAAPRRRAAAAGARCQDALRHDGGAVRLFRGEGLGALHPGLGLQLGQANKGGRRGAPCASAVTAPPMSLHPLAATARLRADDRSSRAGAKLVCAPPCHRPANVLRRRPAPAAARARAATPTSGAS